MRIADYAVGSETWVVVVASVVLACSSDALPTDLGELRDGTAAAPSDATPARTPPASGGAASGMGNAQGSAEDVANGAASSAASGTGASVDSRSSAGGAHTRDGSPSVGGGTNDGTGAGGNTGDGKGGGNTADGARGGDTGDGARGGDTGDGARGGGTGDGCLPTCFPSVLDNVNVIALNDATADGADVEGRMYVAHDANFPSYAIGTRMTPDPTRADLVVGNDLYFGGGSVANGKVSYGGVLELGAASTLGGYHNESSVDFATVAREMTTDSAALAALPANGSVSTGLEVFFTGTDAVLNVFEVQASELMSMTNMILSAPASSTVLVNIRGESVSLHDFGFVLVGVEREHVLYNLPDATSLTMSGVGIQGSILAPYVDLTFANGHVDGQLVVRNFSGSGESHPKYFIGCLPLCKL